MKASSYDSYIQFHQTLNPRLQIWNTRDWVYEDLSYVGREALRLKVVIEDSMTLLPSVLGQTFIWSYRRPWRWREKLRVAWCWRLTSLRTTQSSVMSLISKDDNNFAEENECSYFRDPTVYFYQNLETKNAIFEN